MCNQSHVIILGGDINTKPSVGHDVYITSNVNQYKLRSYKIIPNMKSYEIQVPSSMEDSSKFEVRLEPYNKLIFLSVPRHSVAKPKVIVCLNYKADVTTFINGDNLAHVQIEVGHVEYTLSFIFLYYWPFAILELHVFIWNYVYAQTLSNIC